MSSVRKSYDWLNHLLGIYFQWFGSHPPPQSGSSCGYRSAQVFELHLFVILACSESHSICNVVLTPTEG